MLINQEKLEQRTSKLEGDVAHLKQNTITGDVLREFAADVADDMRTMDQELRGKITSLDKSLSEMVVQECRNAVREGEERERRRKNIIIHNLPERADDPPVPNADVILLVEIFKNLLNLDVNIVRSFRIGKKQSGTEQGAPRSRPVCVVMSNPDEVQLVFRNKDSLLRHEVSKNWSVRSDQTPIQREERATLVKEREAKNAAALQAGEPQDWTIRGNRVVKINRMTGATVGARR